MAVANNKKVQKKIDRLSNERTVYRAMRGLMCDEKTRHIFEFQKTVLTERRSGHQNELNLTDPTDAVKISGLQWAIKELDEQLKRYELNDVDLRLKVIDTQIKELQSLINRNRDQRSSGTGSGMIPPRPASENERE